MSGKTTIRAAFIVPCYNYGRFLGECLDSLLAQTCRDWECIIIDNGSTDNSRKVGEAYAKRDARISYHFTEQRGVSGARNMAVALSKATYIMPVDADDKIAPAYLEKALAAIENKPGVKVVYCDAGLFGASSGRWTLPPYSFKDLLAENSIFCTALYRKSDFETAGGYNEDMKEGFEDWDFWISMLKSGGGVYKIPEVLFYYRIRSQSRNSSIGHEKQLALRRRIYQNHRALYDQYFDWPALVFEQYQVRSELNSLRASRDYRLGRTLMAPLRFLKNLFRPK